MTSKLSIPPDKASYAVSDGTETNRQQLDGGMGAYRRDILEASAQVTVQWSVDENGYNYLRAFYRTTTQRGSLPFLIDLVLNSADLEEYTAYFMPGTFGLTQIQGATYTIGATLEVEPNEADEDYDSALVAVINAFGDNAPNALNIVAHVMNVVWPLE